MVIRRQLALFNLMMILIPVLAAILALIFLSCNALVRHTSRIGNRSGR